MNPIQRRFFFLLLLVFLCSDLSSQRIMENLSRGLVAVQTSTDKVFLSWRLLGSDMDRTAFNLYRDGIKLNEAPLTGATNFTDQATGAMNYTVKTVIDGIETGETYTTSVMAQQYFDIPLRVPDNMTMPNGSSCFYVPNDCSTGDLDGDGELDIVLKWDPSNAKDNSQGGHTGNVYLDGYKLDGTFLFRIDLGRNIRAGAHYTQFQVADYDGDGKAEIVCKTAPGTKDGTGNFISKGPAATANHNADYRNSNGYILTGPEYLTVFCGQTGAELATANYIPARGTVSSWGDSYGNRVDRFLAGTAWLDGVLPSIIMCRGYYTRAVIAAWNFRNGELTSVWTYDSGNTPGVGLYGQGNHNMSVGDVDDDGFDEIIWGAGAVDHNGKLMYRTGLGHGDAMHLSDLDPDRKGLEVWNVLESSNAAYGEEMHCARTGAIIWGTYTGNDVGRGLAANIIPGNRGFEMWSSGTPGVKNKNGVMVSSSRPSINFRIYWDGDAEDELLDGTTITKYNVGTLFTATGCLSNNGSKSTPALSADLFGDWREELIFRTSDNKNLRVFTTTHPTSIRQYTLMHDPIYRAGIAWQNTAYNQPPHLGFYMGNDMETPPPSPIYKGEKKWNDGSIWDQNTTHAWKNAEGKPAVFQQNDRVLFDFTSGKNTKLELSGELQPQDISVNTPFSVEWSGTGTVAGSGSLKKTGSGTLVFQQNNSYTGPTTLWNGKLLNNGHLSHSNVAVKSFASLGGNGTFGGNVQLGHLSELDPGDHTGQLATLRFDGKLQSLGTVSYIYDFLIGDGKVLAHDTLIVAGDWSFSDQTILELRMHGGALVAGSYPLLHCSGTITGQPSRITLKGVPAYLSYSLSTNNGVLTLNVSAPAILTWKGQEDSKWDNGKTSNWHLEGISRAFNGNDSVLFNDESTQRSVIVSDNLMPAQVFVEAESNYIFSGGGTIGGTGGLTKRGGGKLTLSNTNVFTGPVLIEGGTLETASLTHGGVASPLGAGNKAANNLLIDGGKLHYTGNSTTIDRAIRLGANGGSLSVSNASTVLTTGQISGPGRLIKEGPGRIAFSGSNTHQGGTTLLGGTIGLTNDLANTSGLGIGDTITLIGGSISMHNSTTTNNTSNWNLKIPAGATGTLMVDGRSVIGGTITGEGTLNYFTPSTANYLSANAAAFRGTFNVTTSPAGGYFLVFNTAGYAGARINLNNNVSMMYPVTATVTIPIGELSGLSNSELGAGGTGASRITWEIGARNNNSVYRGVISDKQYSGSGAQAAIRKVGSGILTLTNANSYSGNTEIAEGELMINNTTGSGTGTGAVRVMPEARLSGNGYIAGQVQINERGELSPGETIGSLTILNNLSLLQDSFLSIDIDKPNNQNDLLVVEGTLTMQGILQLVPSEYTVFEKGDQFKILEGSQIHGTPAEIRPQSPGQGLEWDLSAFETEGIVRVMETTSLINPFVALRLYPNPVQHELMISLGTPATILRVTLFTASGTALHTQEVQAVSSVHLSMDSYPAGAYLVSIQTNDYSIIKGIIKQ